MDSMFFRQRAVIPHTRLISVFPRAAVIQILRALFIKKTAKYLVDVIVMIWKNFAMFLNVISQQQPLAHIFMIFLIYAMLLRKSKPISATQKYVNIERSAVVRCVHICCGLACIKKYNFSGYFWLFLTEITQFGPNKPLWKSTWIFRWAGKKPSFNTVNTGDFVTEEQHLAFTTRRIF